MSQIDNNLTEEEFDSLVQLKEEHTPYFYAMMYAMGVIVDRNHKYTGHNPNRNVFENFIADAELQDVKIEDSFKQWISKKVTRIMLNDGNYADESFSDSLRDLANYALLWIAWLQYQVPSFEEHDFAKASEPLMNGETFKQPYRVGEGGLINDKKDNIKE